MIVGSILLAFGLQAWWDARQEEERTQGHSMPRANDIEGARVYLQTSMEGRQRRTPAIHSLLLAMSTAEAPTPDSVTQWLGVLWGARQASRTMAAFDDLRESGMLACGRTRRTASGSRREWAIGIRTRRNRRAGDNHWGGRDAFLPRWPHGYVWRATGLWEGGA